MKQLHALTFDLDDTLWDNRPVLMAAEQSLYDWLCRHYPRIGLHYNPEDMLRLRQSLLQQDPELVHDVSRLRKISLGIAAKTAGYDNSLVEPAFDVFLEARHRITPFADVVPALQRLRSAGYILGTLTNGNTDVGRLGLGYLFDFSLSASTTGKAKPHPRMFEQARRQAGVDAAEMAHIGDEPDTDLAGAQNAGITAIWMNRPGLAASHGVEHHAEIQNMQELLELLDLD
jgi:putative hydrolase of the HAD superfamily